MKCSRRNLCSPVASRRPLSQRSLKLLAHVKNNLKPRAPSESPSEPLPSPDSRSSCDDWRPKPRLRVPPAGAGAPPARLPARPPGQTGQEGAQARTEALEAGCLRDSPSRCVLLYAQ